MLYCASSPPASQSNIVQDWDQFFHLWQCFWLILFFLPWGDEIVWALLFNFLHTVIQLAKFCLLPELENIPNFLVFFSFYQCYTSDFSIKRKKGNVQETVRPEKLPSPRNWKLQVFMCTGAKELKGKNKKNGRNNFLELRNFHPQQVWSTWARELWNPVAATTELVIAHLSTASPHQSPHHHTFLHCFW